MTSLKAAIDLAIRVKTPTRRWSVGRWVAPLFLLPVATVALAADQRFDIPAQPLAEALKLFAEQAKMQLLYQPDSVRMGTSNPVVGDFDKREALQLMLEGTNLEAVFSKGNAVTVRAVREVQTSSANRVDAERLRLAAADSTAPVQTSDGNADPADLAAEASGDRQIVEEIIVTAQKRSERLQDVPQSVTVVSSKSLVASGATQLRDFAATVPSLNLSTSGAGYSQITLRGVTAGVDIGQTVGIYVDDVPFGSSSSFNAASQHTLDVALFDVDRVEVLRGPQGTLYGASTMGGLIKYVTPMPDVAAYSFASQLGLAGTRDGGTSYNGSFVANAPLSTDRAALRASAFFSRDGGFVDNVALGEKDANAADFYGGRLDLLLTPNSDFSVRLTAFQQQIDRDGESTADYDFSGAPLAGELEQLRLFPEIFEQRFRVLSATANYAFDAADFTSISSYQTTDFSYVQDLSPFYVPLFGSFGLNYSAVGADTVGSVDKFTQELRLASNDSGAHEWLIGAYYTYEDYEYGQGLLLLDPAGTPLRNDVLYTFTPTIFEELAVFGDVTWKLRDNFDITTGLRYARNEQQFRQFGEGMLGLSSPRRTSSEGVLTYLVNARYRFDEGNMLYARVASGYRAGGPNVVTVDVTTGQPIAPPTFEADDLTSYEMGYKLAAADGRVNVDVGVYFIDWNDMHVSVANGGFSAIGNARGGAEIRGGELAVTLRPVPELTLGASLAITDTEISEDDPGSGAAAGEALPNVPEISAGLALDYEFSGMALRPRIGATVQYVDERMASFDAAPTYRQYTLPEYTTVNLRAGLTFHAVELQVYARNILDERGQLSALNWRGTAMPALLQPRTLGVNLLTRF